jgi:hypothetical protein
MVGLAQETPPNPPTETEKERKERLKREEKEQNEKAKQAEQQRKADEKKAKDSAKQERKRQEQEWKAHLGSPAIITVSTTPEILGQLLTNEMTSRGYIMAEYQPPQVVFGAATPYKVIYTMPSPDSEVFAAKVALGAILGPYVGATWMYAAFELGSVNGVTTMRGYCGYLGNTTAGPKYYETTYSERHRPMLDQIMKNVQVAAEHRY